MTCADRAGDTLAKKGLCAICGKGGKLSEEHIPPQCAGNIKGVNLHTFQDWMDAGGDPEPLPNPQLRQKGTLWATLCERCNNTVLGEWYVPDFCKFVRGTSGAIASISSEELVTLPKAAGDWIRIQTKPATVRPLCVVKVIAGMVLALNAATDPEFRVRHQVLAQFVLDRDAPPLEPYRAYLAVELGDYASFAPTMFGLRDGDLVAYSAIEYPPLAYVLTFDEKQPDTRSFLMSGGLANFAACKYTDVTAVEIGLLISRKAAPMAGEYGV